MLKQIVSSLIIFTVLCVGANTFPVFGQTNDANRDKKTAKVKDKIKRLGLGERVKIKVTTYGKTTYQGYVNAANEDDFVVIDKSGNPNTIRYSDVDKVGGRNLSTGAKIGIGIGIGVGAVLLFLGIVFASLND